VSGVLSHVGANLDGTYLNRAYLLSIYDMYASQQYDSGCFEAWQSQQRFQWVVPHGSKGGLTSEIAGHIKKTLQEQYLGKENLGGGVLVLV
jgi:hypothetical protein